MRHAAPCQWSCPAMLRLFGSSRQGVEASCSRARPTEQAAHDHECGLLFDDAIPKPELDGEGGESPPCSEAGESDPDQPWDEVEIEADIAVAAAPPVETLPPKTKDISRFLALRLVYGSATAKD
eukprot:3249693-Amphidinium_carterae.1